MGDLSSVSGGVDVERYFKQKLSRILIKSKQRRKLPPVIVIPKFLVAVKEYLGRFLFDGTFLGGCFKRKEMRNRIILRPQIDSVQYAVEPSLFKQKAVCQSKVHQTMLGGWIPPLGSIRTSYVGLFPRISFQ